MADSKRFGPITADEQQMVDQFLRDQPCDVSPERIKQLALVMRRTTTAVKTCIERARHNFTANAERYVEIHMEAVEGALERKDYDTAAKAAQWALEHQSAEGKRIVDKPADAKGGGVKILIGLKLGTLADDESVIDATVIPDVPTT